MTTDTGTHVQLMEDTEDSPLDGLTKISHSEIESFLMCERRHYYSYGLGLKSKAPSDALIRGILGHKALETYYSLIKEGGHSPEEIRSTVNNAVLEMQTSEFSENDLGVAMEVIKLFSDYFKARYDAEKLYTIYAIEKPFKLKINDEFYISMVVDLIYKGWEGVVIRDHKFVYDFYAPTIAKILPQLPAYAWALMRDGYTIDRAEYNQIRYRVTKDNQNNPDAKFRTQPVELNMHRLKTTMREYVNAARRIKTLKSMSLEDWGNSITRAYSSSICERCPFKELCAIDLEGGDTESYINMMYDRREK